MLVTKIDVTCGAVEPPLVVFVPENDDALDRFVTELRAKYDPLRVQMVVSGMDF